MRKCIEINNLMFKRVCTFVFVCFENGRLYFVEMRSFVSLICTLSVGRKDSITISLPAMQE